VQISSFTTSIPLKPKPVSITTNYSLAKS